MSGGAFDYENYKLADWAYTVEQFSKNSDDSSQMCKDYMIGLSEQLKLMDNILRRVDYLISGDTDESDFFKELEEESKKIDIYSLVKRMSKCEHCGHYFFPKRNGQKHCSASCRVLFSKKKKAAENK